MFYTVLKFNFNLTFVELAINERIGGKTCNFTMRLHQQRKKAPFS